MRSTFLFFRSDERGVTAVMFALLLIPLLICLGVAVDVTRVYHYREQLQATADETLEQALAGGNERSVRERIESARSAFEMLTVTKGITKATDVKVDVRSVSGAYAGAVTATSRFALAFGDIIRMPAIDVTVVSKSQANPQRVADRRILCQIGRVEDIKRLGCGNMI